MTLNYKKLPYHTVWVEYPDIERIAIEQGAGPTTTWPDGRPKYTVPMIYDPNSGVVVAESTAIAKYLDKTYPNTPPLFPEGTEALQKIASDFVLMSINIPLAMNSRLEQFKLSPRNLEYLEKSVLLLFGKPLDQAYSEDNWVALEQGLGRLAGFLSCNGAGKDNLFAGDKVCFVDFEFAAILLATRNVCGKDGEAWKKICGWHEGKWEKYLDLFELYTTED